MEVNAWSHMAKFSTKPGPQPTTIVPKSIEFLVQPTVPRPLGQWQDQVPVNNGTSSSCSVWIAPKVEQNSSGHPQQQNHAQTLQNGLYFGSLRPAGAGSFSLFNEFIYGTAK